MHFLVTCFQYLLEEKIQLQPPKNLSWLSEEDSISKEERILEKISSIKQQQKDPGSLVTFIWENILYSILGSISKHFKAALCAAREML